MRILTILLLLLFPFSSYAQSLETAKMYEEEKIDASSWKKLECISEKGSVCIEDKCIHYIQNENERTTKIFDRPHNSVIFCHNKPKSECQTISAVFSTISYMTLVNLNDGFGYQIEGKRRFMLYGTPTIREHPREGNFTQKTEETHMKPAIVGIFGSCHEID